MEKMYLLLLGEEDKIGNGLAAIRANATKLVEIDHLDDIQPALTTIIKNNKLYIVIGDYVDLDNGNKRIIVCREHRNSMGDMPVYETANK